ncbi:GNAT family N-acetyltransferase [Metabacillus litoralis]|uniref:GNAT family N-acetyltransferase n=1 Tax=Metabacillus litoralis TaxID=152268 RepID=A0A5C6W4M7_9BACI|nr:GNAT family N-acetyltransferase [Metabacillus litoralis]TXC92886.1 GNAT family N-acetyltransferase [Metabacillus litoralis]
MKNITFDNIYNLGKVVAENDQYKHFHYTEMLTSYSSNFIEFKHLPSLSEFLDAEEYLREYHLKRGQNHVKFTFPDNEKPTSELISFFNDNGYEIGFMELYAIKPQQFPTSANNPDIEVAFVTDENIEIFCNLQYQHNLEYGSEFADQKHELIKRQFKNQDILQILAFYKGNPAGYVVVIVSEETAEIDNLTVDEKFQNKGIGRKLQQYVMEAFPEKIVILIADGEDTPREMYKKQNYQFQGFQYEAQKVYK